MRGEHTLNAKRRCSASGSSPHARGTLEFADGDEGYGGIIPACAGNTLSCRRVRPCRRDHPRMRGEHMSWRHIARGRWGSSPHARGTHNPNGDLVVRCGIIPACAGNTPRVSIMNDSRWDHPRMRGEHLVLIVVNIRQQGSSPHARGTRRRSRNMRARAGIIPACAGNTGTDAHYRVEAGDHPRMRGEHVRIIGRLIFRQGSSPHARGTPGLSYPLSYGVGIIPACAGNTSRRTRPRRRARDHPRMRGEHT